MQGGVTLIDRRNYHLFQPLLYQVATASLSPADIATPIRAVLREQFNTVVHYGRVIGIDRQGKAVLLEDRRMPYDYLVLATGARHDYFGKDEWERTAPGLKKIDDATALTRLLSRTSIPSFSSASLALADSVSGKVGSTRGPA